MAASLHTYEVFLLGVPGIIFFRAWILLAMLASAFLLAVKKPRWEWKRGLLLAGLIFLLEMVGLAGDLLPSLTNSPSLPVLLANGDRALELLVALALIWFFLFPRRSKTGDGVMIGSVVLALAVAGASFVYLYVNPVSSAFNANILSLVWDSVRWIVLLAAIMLLLIRRPMGWGSSFLALLFLIAGTSLQVILGDGSTNLPGLARLFDLLAFPMAAMRFTLSGASDPALTGGGSQARQARHTSSESIPQLSDLILTLEEMDLPQAMTAWICSSMRVEVSYFLANSEHGDGVDFISGFDRISAIALPEFQLTSEAAPQLHFALTGRETLRLEKPEANAALQAAAEKAGLAHAGPALFVPLVLSEEPAVGILMLASYSDEAWREEDENIGRMFAQACAAAFQQIHARNNLTLEVEEKRQALAQTAQESERLQAERLSLETELQQAEEAWREERRRAEGLASLVQEQDALQSESGAATENGEDRGSPLRDASIAHLQAELLSARTELENARRDSARFPEVVAIAEALEAENHTLQSELDQLRTAGAAASPAQASAETEAAGLRAALEESENRYHQEISRIQDELRKTLTEYAHLQSALLQPTMVPEPGKKPGFGADIGMVTGLISEIRQPFSSMVGYTDLLLSESAGILGAMQRKFLDRIRASITRTESLFEDLLQLLLLPEKIATPPMQPVDVAGIIDGAITGVSEIIREKNLVLHLDVSDDLPAVEIDRDALQQIFNHLIQNAALITPPEKEVVLTAHAPQAVQNQRAMLITVKDSGPGIAAEDQPRVFTRLYRTEGPMIEGLGDSGVGMAVARTLTEAMGGRIWLESQIGHGTTFYILLPVQVGQPLADSPQPSR
jgi:signal transduction histidine kinase/GAF domain-containing protein